MLWRKSSQKDDFQELYENAEIALKSVLTPTPEEQARKQRLEAEIHYRFQRNKEDNDLLRRHPDRCEEWYTEYPYHRVYLDKMQQVLPVIASQVSFTTQTVQDNPSPQRKTLIRKEKAENDPNFCPIALEFPDWLHDIKKGDQIEAHIFTGQHYPFFAEHKDDLRRRTHRGIFVDIEGEISLETIIDRLREEQARYRSHAGLIKPSNQLFLEGKRGIWMCRGIGGREVPYRIVLPNGNSYENLNHPYFKIKEIIESDPIVWQDG